MGFSTVSQKLSFRCDPDFFIIAVAIAVNKFKRKQMDDVFVSLRMELSSNQVKIPLHRLEPYSWYHADISFLHYRCANYMSRHGN